MKYRTSRVVCSGRRQVLSALTRLCQWGQFWPSFTYFRFFGSRLLPAPSLPCLPARVYASFW